MEKTRPRYMFWSEGDGFWEREPIGWMEADGEKRWTRSVKLGALGEQGEGKKTRVSHSIPYASLQDEKLMQVSGITPLPYPRKLQVRRSLLDPPTQRLARSDSLLPS